MKSRLDIRLGVFFRDAGYRYEGTALIRNKIAYMPQEFIGTFHSAYDAAEYITNRSGGELRAAFNTAIDLTRPTVEQLIARIKDTQ